MAKRIVLLLLIVLGIWRVHGAQMWVTTLDKSKLLQRQNDISPNSGTGSGSTKVTTNPGQVFQEIYGFGGTLTETAAINFINLKNKNSGNYQNILNQFFNPSSGAGLSVIRVPMGSTDMSISPYFTYDETYNDWLFADFSWERDTTYILPVLKDIVAINPDIKIMITPWTAPTWMKTSVNASNAYYWGTINSRYYDDFAYYFQFVIQKYQSLGINIYSLSIQNEPYNEPNDYPVMRASPNDEAQISIALGPKLANANLKTKILVWDHNWINYDYPIQVFKNQQANGYIAGSAFHCYNGTVSQQQYVYQAFPDKEIWFTECAGTGPSNFQGNIPWNTQTLYMGAINYWARTVLHWTLATDTSYGPKTNGGCPNCRGFITVHNDAQTVDWNEEYYGTAMFNKFLKFPAYRMSCTQDGGYNCVYSICFKNADSSILVVFGNFCQTPQPVIVQGQGNYLSTTVPVGLTSIVW